MPSPPALILASGSPRRKELLGSLGLKFTVRPADIDETVRPGEGASTYALRVAQEKASSVAQQAPNALVLAADTIVVLDGEIFGKPRDRQDARERLARLSGRNHQVLTAVAFDGTLRRAWVQSTELRFRKLSSEEIAWYVDTGEPDDKSGGYAFQGIGTFMVESVTGSPSNVAGLPMGETVKVLLEAGFPLPWSV
jgi:septum formation protein